MENSTVPSVPVSLVMSQPPGSLTYTSPVATSRDIRLIPVQTQGIARGPRRHWAARASLGLGITQIILGVIVFIAQILLFAKGSEVAATSSGFVCGILFILTGGFGIGAAKRGTRGLIITVMVLAIISAISTILLVSFSSIGMIIDSYQQPYHRECTYHLMTPEEFPPSTYSNSNEGPEHREPLYDKFISSKTSRHGGSLPSIPTVRWTDSVTTTTSTVHPDTTTTTSWSVSPKFYRICTYEANYLIHILISVHGVMIGLALVELGVAIVASALTCRTICCITQRQHYVVDYAVSQPPSSNPNPDNIISIPPELHSTSQLYATGRPPSYTSLNVDEDLSEKAKEAMGINV